MTFSITRGLLPRIVCLATLMAVAAGCTKEDMDKCGRTGTPSYDSETGSMTVTMRGLKTFAGFDDDDYSIEIREAHSDGEASENMECCRPAGSFRMNGKFEEFFVPAFDLPPQTEAFIDIYHGSQLVETISKYSSGSPITVNKGRLTKVMADMNASIGITISLTDWETIDVVLEM